MWLQQRLQISIMNEYRGSRSHILYRVYRWKGYLILITTTIPLRNQIVDFQLRYLKMSITTCTIKLVFCNRITVIDSSKVIFESAVKGWKHELYITTPPLPHTYYSITQEQKNGKILIFFGHNLPLGKHATCWLCTLCIKLGNTF